MGDVLEAKGFASEQEELEHLRRRSAILFNENIDLKVKLEEYEQQAIDVRQLAVSKAKFGAALAMSLIEAGYVVVREAWAEAEGDGIQLAENEKDGKLIVHVAVYGEETHCRYLPTLEDLVANDWMIVLDVEALDAEAEHAVAGKDGEDAGGDNNETSATAAQTGDGLGFPSIPTTVRAKFKCLSVTEHDGGHKQIKFHPVCSSDPNHENKAFSDYTPGGSAELIISPGKPAGNAFKAGKEYYLDFTEAPATEK